MCRSVAEARLTKTRASKSKEGTMGGRVYEGRHLSFIAVELQQLTQMETVAVSKTLKKTKKT